MEVKVSVIIPVYNVENYIEECMNSLINQTLQEIEIICVDDGSTDGTLELLRQFEADDKRIKVIQQKNQYAGVARNNGMQHASGEYMIFLDADDFFDLTMLEKSYLEAKRTDADVVLFGGQIYDDVMKEVKPAPRYLNTQILPQSLPFSCADTEGQLLDAITPAPWTKLFRSEFVRRNGILFQPFQNSNDVYFVLMSICTAERISYVDECLVNYRKGMDTNLQSIKNKAPLCFLDAYYSVYRTLMEKGIYEYVKKGFRAAAITACLYNYATSKDKRIKEVLLEAFLEERFREMDLFGGAEEEYPDYKKCKRLQLLIDTYVWKKEIKQGLAEPDDDVTQHPEISIVLPVNNGEENIRACLKSILNQTFGDFEVICVDENSQDASLDLIYQLKVKDCRINAYWQEENDIGAAHSLGIAHARGNYILFLEAVNTLEKGALKKAYEEAKKNEAEIVFLAGKTFTTEIMLRKEFLQHEGLLELPFLRERKKLGAAALGAAKRALVLDKAEVHSKGVGKKPQATKEDVREMFQLLYDIYDELHKRNACQEVIEDFRRFAAEEIVQIFQRITKYSLKEMLVKELFCERFEKFGIFEKEEERCKGDEEVREDQSEAYDCLLGLRKGYLWQQRMDMLRQRDEFKIIVNKTNDRKPKVSVIVPCYNIEQYVGECLESLMNQTMKDIEIICVNDGSVDGTKDVLMEYAKQDSRIIVVEQENSGLSVGRNVGVKNAGGEYICFVDSDDLLELSALEELYQQVKEKDLDILFYDGESFFETNDIREKKPAYIDYYIRKFDYSDYRIGTELMCAMYENSEYRQSACMQMIRREYFVENELWFHPGILHEDNPFTFKGLLCSERVGHVNKAYYLRRVKENSIMTSKTTFSHSYGYFASFLDMWKIAQEMEFSREQSDVIGRMLLQTINVARSDFRAMDNDEKYMFECLEPMERQLYFSLVVNAEIQLNQIRTLREDRKGHFAQISDLRKKLQNAKKVELELKKIKKSKAYKMSRTLGRIIRKIKKILHLT